MVWQLTFFAFFAGGATTGLDDDACLLEPDGVATAA
jgi:hypothetical protein